MQTKYSQIIRLLEEQSYRLFVINYYMEYSILEIQHLELKRIKEFQVFLLQYKYK